MHDTKLNMLMQWLQRGWALVPLHDVFQGHCSCTAGAQCGSAGKHPRPRAWQEDGQLVRDPAVLEALTDAHPEWNWGAATGRASNMWVLDWDISHDQEILAWFAQVAQRHPGELDTLTLGPTGGGGRHYVFALPDFEPRGSQTRNRYGLPPGLDVRGHHGQIVVSPSVSAKGPYGGVLIDAPQRRAPAWLEDIVRPQPVDERVDRPVADLRLGLSTDGQTPDSRASAYARSAIEAIVGELAAAPGGTRNDTAYRTACRLIELANAPWSPWHHDIVYAMWWEAGVAHPDGSYVPASELLGVWQRAERAVGQAAAVLPASALGGEHVPIVPFPMAARPASVVEPLQLMDPGPYGVPSGSGMAAGGVAGGPAGGVAGGVVADPVRAFIDRMLTPEQLRGLPPPRPLIRGLLDLDTCAWLIGKPGSCKSFVALDFAVHVGRGEAWQGRPVHQGLVWYIAAEGAGGMTLRAAAVEREYEEIKEVRFLPEPVPADERRMPNTGAWSVMVAAAALERPVLIIIDTQARVTIGLNENDNAEMGYYASQADRLRRASGACVLTVHHMGRTGQNARGASAIDGAQDAELRIERHDQSNLIKLHVDKQKDQAQSEPIDLGLRRSDGGVSEDGRDLSSLVVIRPASAGGALEFQDPTPVREPGWKHHMRLLYQVIFDQFNGGSARGGLGGTFAEIRSAFMALPEMVAIAPNVETRRKYFRRAWNGSSGQAGLVARGLIARPLVGDKVFKVIVLSDQSEDGVLTINDSSKWTEATDGWIAYTPTDGLPE